LRTAEAAASLDEALDAAAQTPQRVMLTLDESTGAKAALEPAVRLAEQLGATFHLAQVITPAPRIIMVEPGMDYRLLAEISERQEKVLTKDAFLYLANVEEWVKAKAPGLKVEKTVLKGFPAPQLVAFIRETNPFLMVMATHARSELGQILLGSVAEEVLRESHLPVLLVPIPKGFEGYGLQPDKGEEKAAKKAVTTAQK
jgi:nucleotide-binding universal stress UspA family protein